MNNFQAARTKEEGIENSEENMEAKSAENYTSTSEVYECIIDHNEDETQDQDKLNDKADSQNLNIVITLQDQERD